MFADKIRSFIETKRKDWPLVNMADRGKFVLYSLVMFQIIRASEHLLETAADVAAPTLKGYFEHHLGEETDHVHWLAEDMRSMGVEPYSEPLNFNAIELPGTIYYMIHHYGPEALLGYMAVMEGSPAPLNQVKKLEEIYGERAIRTIKYHAVHDVEHAKELFRVIDKLPDHKQLLVMTAVVYTLDKLKILTKEFA